MLFAYFVLAGTNSSSEGKLGGMVETGDFIFALTVICANIKVLYNSNTINWGLLFFVFGSIITYILAQTCVSELTLFKYSDQFGSMQHVVQYSSTWFALLFFIVLFGLLDYGINQLRDSLKKNRIAKQESLDYQKELRDAADPNQIREKQGEYVNTGYAFSGSAG